MPAGVPAGKVQVMFGPFIEQPFGTASIVRPRSGVSTNTSSPSVAELLTVAVKVYWIACPTRTSVSATGSDDLASVMIGAASGVAIAHSAEQACASALLPTTVLFAVPLALALTRA